MPLVIIRLALAAGTEFRHTPAGLVIYGRINLSFMLSFLSQIPGTHTPNRAC
jgi:hypothetical protein